MAIASIDALALAQALIRRPSVTPKDAGALDILEAVLKELGFVTHRLPFADVSNLYARLGQSAPHFCFAGHTDVVPVGEGWKADPFAADVREGVLYGRGAADMKSAIAAFVAAVARTRIAKGSISLGTFSYFGSDQVQVIITALQTDGSTNTYQGTYTVENGQITYPVSEVTIAGHLLEIFKSMTAASDLKFIYGTNAPTVRIEGLTLGGR